MGTATSKSKRARFAKLCDSQNNVTDTDRTVDIHCYLAILTKLLPLLTTKSLLKLYACGDKVVNARLFRSPVHMYLSMTRSAPQFDVPSVVFAFKRVVSLTIDASRLQGYRASNLPHFDLVLLDNCTYLTSLTAHQIIITDTSLAWHPRVGPTTIALNIDIAERALCKSFCRDLHDSALVAAINTLPIEQATTLVLPSQCPLGLYKTVCKRAVSVQCMNAHVPECYRTLHLPSVLFPHALQCMTLDCTGMTGFANGFLRNLSLLSGLHTLHFSNVSGRSTAVALELYAGISKYLPRTLLHYVVCEKNIPNWYMDALAGIPPNERIDLDTEFWTNLPPLIQTVAGIYFDSATLYSAQIGASSIPTSVTSLGKYYGYSWRDHLDLLPATANVAHLTWPILRNWTVPSQPCKLVFHATSCYVAHPVLNYIARSAPYWDPRHEIVLVLTELPFLKPMRCKMAALIRRYLAGYVNLVIECPTQDGNIMRFQHGSRGVFDSLLQMLQRDFQHIPLVISPNYI